MIDQIQLSNLAKQFGFQAGLGYDGRTVGISKASGGRISLTEIDLFLGKNHLTAKIEAKPGKLGWNLKILDVNRPK